MIDFKDKIVLITGASRGVGEALAHELSKRGAIIIGMARNESALLKVKSQCENPDKVHIYPIDLSQVDTIEPLVKKIMTKFKRIDYLINNAGITQRSQTRDTILAVDREIFEVNYFANIALTKALLPYLLKQSTAHITVISSAAGKFGVYQRSAYSASKHALHGFYETLRLEESKKANLKILLACLGPIKTDISKHALTATGKPHVKIDNLQSEGMPVDKCAKKILQAIDKNKLELTVGVAANFAVWLKRVMPTLFFRLMRKVKV